MHSLTADPESGDRAAVVCKRLCLYIRLYEPLVEQSKHPIFLLHLADSKDVFTSTRSYVKRFPSLGYFSACDVVSVHCIAFNVPFTFHWNSAIKGVKAEVRGRISLKRGPGLISLTCALLYLNPTHTPHVYYTTQGFSDLFLAFS